ncbi:MAG: STAS domain-containing protein [Pseudomonadota bacterium]
MTERQEERIELEPALKAPAAEALLATLKDNRGVDLTLDGSKVTFLSGACLQVLLSAMETWRADGVSLAISAPSDELKLDAAILGAADMLNFRSEEVAQ